MKTIKYLLFAFIAPFVLAGCSDDIKYTPGEGEDPDCYGVYFPSQEYATDNERDPAEPTTLPFTAKRKNYKDAITVPVEVTGTQDGIFTVSESNSKQDRRRPNLPWISPMPRSARPTNVPSA